MENQKVLNCPNCGAATSNLKNCEYCGSLFVRFVDKNIEINSALYGKDAFVFPELLEALKKNFEMQENSQGTHFICTDADIKELNLGVQFISSNLLPLPDGTLAYPVASYPSIAVVFYFIKQTADLQMFKEMDIFPLFTDISDETLPDGHYNIQYSIDFGADYFGAAQLFTRIAFQVYGANEASKCVCETWDGDEGKKETNTKEAKVVENARTSNAPDKSSGKKSKKGCLKWTGIFVGVIIAVIIAFNFFNTETMFSTLSEQEQETLMTDLYERLELHFISDLQIDEQLAQDVSVSYLWDALSGEDLENIIRQEIENKTGIEVREIGERWATDNNLNLEDLTNNNVIDVLFEDYVSYLTQKIANDAITIMQEMKAVFREGLNQMDNVSEYAWIVGDWYNSETGYEFTFEADGTFFTGDDCRSTGTFTIQGNTVHLNGKTVCPDCEDCEESDYNETMTIAEEILEGYQKLQ